MKRVRVTLDGLDASFEASCPEERWNGWLTPYFSREEGERLMVALNAWTDGGVGGRYDAERDVFVIASDPAYSAEEVARRPLGFRIGEGWCWEEDRA